MSNITFGKASLLTVGLIITIIPLYVWNNLETSDFSKLKVITGNVSDWSLEVTPNKSGTLNTFIFSVISTSGRKTFRFHSFNLPQYEIVADNISIGSKVSVWYDPNDIREARIWQIEIEQSNAIKLIKVNYADIKNRYKTNREALLALSCFGLIIISLVYIKHKYD